MNQSMKRTLLCTAFLLTGVLSVHAADDKIRKAVDQGLVTSEFLKTLTYDDVPEDWKAQKKSVPNEKHTKLSYSRGGVRRLEVQWANDWTGDKGKMFVATVYHGEKRLAKIVRIGDSTTVFSTDTPKGYQVMTSIKDDGTASVTVLSDDSSFIDGVIIKGRDTHLLDDLEYTKAALAVESITKPLVGAIQDALDKKPRKKARKSK
jgi:hypothetical protein